MVKFSLLDLFRLSFEFSREKCLAVEETAVVDLAASAATDVEGKSRPSRFHFLRFSVNFLGKISLFSGGNRLHAKTEFFLFLF